MQNLWYGLSLGSVLLLAAIGLAITFGVMGVINMAHGEMVMLGAYTTFVVQEVIRTQAPWLFDWSLAIALPLAFLVAGAVGVAIERGIIRFLYGRPLETLLATWGLSLILQQTVRTIFGQQYVDSIRLQHKTVRIAVIDLIEMKQISWDDESLGASYHLGDISDEYLVQAEEYREKIIEAAAEYDDEVMEAYLSEMPIDPPKIIDAIRRATINLELIPVLCGSALKNKGIQPLLNAIAKFLPSPVDVPPIKGTHPETGDIIECKAEESDPLAALIFKVSMIEGRKLSFVRVYSGRLKAGEDVYNPSLKKKEKLARILQMHANKRERVDTIGAGSIAGIVGLKDSSTGETLCSPDHPVLLENIEVYEPVISVAVEPKTHADQEKMDVVLQKFMAEDPTLRVRQDEDTGQTILSGMGELHLEIITSRMQREFNTNVNVGRAPGGL